MILAILEYMCGTKECGFDPNDNKAELNAYVDRVMDRVSTRPQHSWWYRMGSDKSLSLPGLFDAMVVHQHHHPEFVQNHWLSAFHRVVDILGVRKLRGNNALVLWSMIIEKICPYLEWGQSNNRQVYGLLMGVFKMHIEMLLALYCLTNLKTNQGNYVPPPCSDFVNHVKHYLRFLRFVEKERKIWPRGSYWRNYYNSSKKDPKWWYQEMRKFCTETTHHLLLLNVLLTQHVQLTFGTSIVPIIGLTDPSSIDKCVAWMEQQCRSNSECRRNSECRAKPHVFEALQLVKETMVKARRKSQFGSKPPTCKPQTMTFGEFTIQVPH